MIKYTKFDDGFTLYKPRKFYFYLNWKLFSVGFEFIPSISIHRCGEKRWFLQFRWLNFLMNFG